MTLGDHPSLTPDQKQLIRQALGEQWNITHRWKNQTAEQDHRDKLTERLRFIEDTVADVDQI